MIIIQVLAIGVLVTLYSRLLVQIFKKFKLKVTSTYFFIVPMIVFSVGFVLRLNSDIDIVNLGFYLTDFTWLFVSVLFTIFLLFGQLKYWKSEF